MFIGSCSQNCMRLFGFKTKSPMFAPQWHTGGGGFILSYPMNSEKQGVWTEILHQFRVNELSRGCSQTRSPSDFERKTRLGCSPIETSLQSCNCTYSVLNTSNSKRTLSYSSSLKMRIISRMGCVLSPSHFFQPAWNKW